MHKHHIFHHNDLDGHASAAIIALAQDQHAVILFYEMTYGDLFDDSQIDYDNDYVYIVDFSLQPMDRMAELIKKANHLTWIDHHQTSVDWVNENLLLFDFRICRGVVKTGPQAACALCWEYFFSKRAVPIALEMLSDYDCWNKNSKYSWDDELLPLQMILNHTKPLLEKSALDFWKDLFNYNSRAEIGRALLPEGKLLKEFSDKQDKKNIRANGYAAEFAGYTAYIVGTTKRGSLQFENAICTRQYDLLVTYHRKRASYWVIGLYSVHSHINCGQIAKELGQQGPFKSGGGHPGAAGFQTNTAHLAKLLNWELTENK